ncbi:hypothetical protein GE09DRAFT_1215779 [Coniochaeta sp. 2T2.1]|nr:hypothetical protein GE09DRAFT_1215779 [Coniochaeta sp. 2T2.1]
MELVTAGITIAGAGAGITAGQFAYALSRAYKEARMFDEDIAELATWFDAFADSIAGVENSFRMVCEEHPTLQVLEWISQRGLLKNLATMSRHIDGQIETFRTRFEHVAKQQGLSSLARKAWWTYHHKEDIEKLHPRMNSLTSYFSLVYDALHLNILLTMKITPAVKENIRRLKQLVKKKEKTIQRLRRHPLIQQSPDSTLSGAGLTTEHVDAAKLILALSRSLRESEKLADIGPKLDEATGRILPERRQTRRSRDPRTVQQITQEPVPRPSNRRPRPSVIIPESALRKLEATNPEEHADDSPEAQTDSLVSARFTLLTRQTSSSTARTTPETPITPITPAPAAESSFTDVRESSTHHSLIGRRSEAIRCVLNTGWPRHVEQYVIAHRFGMELHENFICLYKARELSLDLRELDPEVEDSKMVLVVSEAGRLVEKRVVGSVETRWWTAHPPGWKQMMWVVDGRLPDGVSIALGRPFEMRKKHYQDNVARRN